MEKWKAKRDFAEADDLFQRKKYNEALEILNRLNREFPNNRRVMMPRALCMAEMGRYHEASTICEQILAMEEYPRARRLYNKLQPMLKAEYVPVYEPVGVFDRLETGNGEEGTSAFGDERPAYIPPLEPQGGGWGRPLLITAVVLLVAGALGGAAYYYVVHQKYGEKQVAKTQPPVEPAPAAPSAPAPSSVEEESEPYQPDFSQYNRYADPASVAAAQEQMAQQQQQAQPPAPFPGGRRDRDDEDALGEDAEDGTDIDFEEVDISEEGLLGLGVGLLAILFVVRVVLEFVVLFCTLLLLNKLPRPTLGENLLLIAGVSVAAILVLHIPYVGRFAALFMIITVFQLNFVDCLVMLLVHAVVFVCTALAFAALIGLSFGAFI